MWGEPWLKEVSWRAWDGCNTIQIAHVRGLRKGIGWWHEGRDNVRGVSALVRSCIHIGALRDDGRHHPAEGCNATSTIVHLGGLACVAGEGGGGCCMWHTTMVDIQWVALLHRQEREPICIYLARCRLPTQRYNIPST